VTPLEAIRAAHKLSGLTVTELADATKLTRARLAQWLAQGRADAIPGRGVYSPPTDAHVRLIVDAAVESARTNLQKVSILRDSLPKSG